MFDEIMKDLFGFDDDAEFVSEQEPFIEDNEDPFEESEEEWTIY